MFSQVKGIKYLEWDFYSLAWVMPQVWDLGVLGSNIFSKHGHVAYQIEGAGE